MERVSEATRRGQAGEVHLGRRLGHHLRPLQGELPSPGGNASQVRRSKGLAVISLSLDDPTDAKAVAEAKVPREKKAVFTNVLLNEKYGNGFDRLDINGHSRRVPVRTPMARK